MASSAPSAPCRLPGGTRVHTPSRGARGWSLGPRQASWLWSAPAVPPSAAGAQGGLPGHTQQSSRRAGGHPRECLEGRKQLMPLGASPGSAQTQVTVAFIRVCRVSCFDDRVSRLTASPQRGMSLHYRRRGKRPRVVKRLPGRGRTGVLPQPLGAHSRRPRADAIRSLLIAL